MLFTLLNRVCHSNLGHSQKSDDTFVCCFFPEFANATNQKALKQCFCLICITVFKFVLFPFLGIEPKLNILEIVKPVETVEVVIDPDAHHAEAEAHLVEEAQVITLDGTKHIAAISDETSEQVTRWAAALEGYRKEQERLGIPYGNSA